MIDAVIDLSELTELTTDKFFPTNKKTIDLMFQLLIGVTRYSINKHTKSKVPSVILLSFFQIYPSSV